MILLFRPTAPQLEWSLFSDATAEIHTAGMTGDWWTPILGHLPPGDSLEAIGYFLHNGGDRFTQTLEPLTPGPLPNLAEAVYLHPEENRMTLDLVEFWTKRDPGVPHLLFCDTAFFARLPAPARDYALPYRITRRGLHRFGGYGLCHEQTWKQTRALSGGAAGKVISAYLGDQPNLAAIQNGSPVETTIGLTHLEGIMSSQGCGDIDPTIIFQLEAAGVSYPTINRLLSTQSGFMALAGKPCGLAEILRESANAGPAAARRALTYQLIKSLGAMLAALGGADALVFSANAPSDVMPLIWDLCDALSFLGIRCPRGNGCTGAQTGLAERISTEDSALAVFVTQYDPWRSMGEQARAFINDKEWTR